MKNLSPGTISFLRLFELCAGALVASILISTLFSGHTNLGELGLGDRTQSFQATEDSFLTHIIRNTDEEEKSFLTGWEKRGQKPVCLMLGYSQAHSINEMQEGQLTYSKILFDKYKAEIPPIDLLCQSLPNANMTEYYALFGYWLKRLKIQSLVLPVCLDKMRNDDQRPEYLQNLGYSGFQLSGLSDALTMAINKSLTGFPKRNVLAVTKSDKNDNAALMDTVQESVEKTINNWLSKNWKGWELRSDVRGNLFHYLYLLRNTALGISSNTKRKIIPAKYEMNMKALEDILLLAAASKVKVLIYVPPIRMDIPIPYVDTEYDNFKKDVIAIVGKHSQTARYLNIEGIVPGPYWGDLPATDLSGKRQPDFMHFKAMGHQLTADALAPTINELVRP